MRYIRTTAAVLLLFAAALLRPEKSGALTIVDTSGIPNLAPEGVLQYISKMQNIFSTNGPAFANAFMLANLGGYPVGTSSLGGPGHFFAGISASLGLAHMEYYDHDLERPEGYYPAYAPNPVIFAGIGIDSRLDLLLKFFIYNDSIYLPPIDYSYAKLTSIGVYAFGARFRYQAVPRVIIFPGLFHFGGIAVLLGGDVMTGNVAFDGEYLYDLGMISTAAGDVGVNLNSIYSAKMRWYIGSITLEALAYFDIFWIFSIYTGAGMTMAYGTLTMQFIGYALGSAYPAGANAYFTTFGTDDLGYVTVISDNLYKPKFYHPLFIIGLDINLYIVRVSVESVVDMRNRSDVNIQLGARFQY
ncbi:MAG: hypothetical protein JXA20_14715 [Spirochaetes bacterium]|nr:hypothetical protein [Spirochaetota bacterium]